MSLDSKQLSTRAIVFLVSLLVSACAGNMPGLGVNVKADADDPCGQQRVALGESQHYYAQNIIAGAAIGAVAGGIIGAMTGGGGKAIGQGMAAGAVAGGVGGYFHAKQQETADAQALAASVNADALREYGEIDKATQSFIALRDCRFAAARAIRSDYRAKRVTRDDAQQRLNRLRTLFNEDIALAEEIGVKMTDRAKEYHTASDELLRNDPAAKARYTSWAEQQDRSAPRQQSHSSKRKTTSSKTESGTGGNALSAAKQTHTNEVKQADYANQLQQSKQMASKEFSLEGQISMDLPSLPAGFAATNMCRAG
ncbi:conserved hypothetical protein [Gammaproteobacteria bacterium]